MYWVYTLLCEDDSLYTGFTDDIKHRIYVHYHGLRSAAKYTRSHKVKNLAALWKTDSETGARKLEYRIKQLPKSKKLLLIEKPEQVLDHAKKSCMGRYTCINLQNFHTIEFRMWRGTLKYNTLIATLQMVKRLCEVAVFSSEKELQDMSWWSFICHVTEPELITYLKERQLYINEPVMTEEEI